MTRCLGGLCSLWGETSAFSLLNVIAEAKRVSPKASRHMMEAHRTRIPSQGIAWAQKSP